MSLIDELKKFIPDEIIGSSNVAETAEMVMLDIAYSPVVEGVVNEEILPFNIPIPVKVIERGDGRYEIRRTDPPDFRILSEAEIKRMRARFLLLKAYYADKMDMLSYSEKQTVIALYFNGSFLDIKKMFQSAEETGKQ